MFNQKKLKIQISEPVLGGLERVIWELTDYPVDAVINKTVWISYDAHIKIYGVSKETMESILTYSWKMLFIKRRGIKIFADEGDGERLIYVGQINNAVPVYEQPNVYIDIRASAGTFQNTMGDIPPSSIKGDVPVPDVFAKIAADYGMGFKNNDVPRNIVCKNPYFDQFGLTNRLAEARRAYNVDAQIYFDRVEIYPKGNAGRYGRIWYVSNKDYIGYPSFTDTGILLNFDSIFEVELFDTLDVSDSEISEANNRWRVQRVSYNLSTKIGGKWFMQINGGWISE